ncbi:MAG: Rho termination factor N-terminal domain-containing protein, partial [Verrucomicrobiota bacterium]|nr:Rho termination factor N-terminal domain-containing protein [Verrucomicrobiota bacterium]
MPRPANKNPQRRPSKRGPSKRGPRKRGGSNVPDGLPRDVEEHGEDLAALEEADGEEIRMGDLQKKDIAELNIMAKEMHVENFGTMRKHEVIFQILRKHAEDRGVLIAEGVLEILPE